MKRKIGLYLDDIITSINKIETYVKGIVFDEFKKDGKTIDAVIRNLEIIGEAANNIPKAVREKSPDIPWAEVIGMRNKVIHEYFGVDLEILWATVREDLIDLKGKIKQLIKLNI